MSAARSWLYVPADQRRFLDSAPARGADALIVDLEDSVAPRAKDTARATVTDWLPGELPGRSSSGNRAVPADPSSGLAPGAEIWLRLNAGALEPDVAVLTAAVTGVVLPKASPALLAQLDEILLSREEQLSLTRQFAVLGLIETAQGLLDARQLAAMPRVEHLSLGEADLCAELRLAPSPAGDELWPLRMQIVVASAAAGIGAPVGPVATDFRDTGALRVSSAALLRAGYRARSAIHPAQIPVINEVFSPSAQDVEQARRLVERFEESGGSAMTDGQGQLIDLAVVRSAREILSRAR